MNAPPCNHNLSPTPNRVSPQGRHGGVTRLFIHDSTSSGLTLSLGNLMFAGKQEENEPSPTAGRMEGRFGSFASRNS